MLLPAVQSQRSAKAACLNLLANRVAMIISCPKSTSKLEIKTPAQLRSTHWLDPHVFNQHAIAKQSTFNRCKIKVAIMLALHANRNAISANIQSVSHRKIEGCSHLPTFNRSPNANATTMLCLRVKAVKPFARRFAAINSLNDARSAAALAKLSGPAQPRRRKARWSRASERNSAEQAGCAEGAAATPSPPRKRYALSREEGSASSSRRRGRRRK